MDNAATLEVLSAPFIRPYPFGYKKIWFNGCKINNITVGKAVSFINIPYINNVCVSLLGEIKIWIKKTEGLKTIIVYGLHVNLVLVVKKIRKYFPNVKLCLIIPDLPEYMGCNRYVRGLGIRNMEIDFLYSNITLFDKYIVLTEQIAEKLNLNPSSYSVIEGIYLPQKLECIYNSDLKNDKYILYTGSLAIRYGIIELLKAFELIENKEIKLVICGDGEAKNEILEYSKKNMRIIYLGILCRERILLLQKWAFLLINPRNGNEDYTKYSFPSKTMEYLASGTPTLMYRLPGIPQEYYDYCFFIEGEDLKSFVKSINDILNKPYDVVCRKSILAKKFIIEKKNPRVQCLKIINLINK